MKKLEIIKNGRCYYHIVSANNSTSCDRYAASQLQKHIYKSTNTFIPYFSDRCSKRGPEIIIGFNTRNANEFVTDEELTSLGEEGFLIKTVDSDILITGKTSRGTLYGVYEFLERFLGFRAFTKDVEKIDMHTELIVDDMYICETPDFEYRDAYFRFAFNGEFCAKNRLNTTLGDISAEKGGNFKFYNCHHSFDDLIPHKKYFESHPEYYAEIDGKRVCDQPCLSRPEVFEIAVNTLEKWIEENPECRVFSVAQNDNPNYCRCDACRAVDEYEGSPSGSIIRFVNRVAEAVEKKHPNVLIHTFAYRYSDTAPKHVKPRKNVIVRLCNIECEWGSSIENIAENKPDSKCAEFLNNVKEWSAICDRVYIWDYAVNFRNYLQPFPNFFSMTENIRMYKKYGIKGVLQQGNFSYGGGAAMDDLKSYIIARLLWNVNTNPQEVIDEFSEGVFGKGASYIKEYIALISTAVKGQYMTLYDTPDAAYLTDELISECDALFDLAEQSAENDAVRKRISRERLSIEYLKTVRIENDEERCKAVDLFAEKVRSFGLTEIMERVNLDDSFEYMKLNRYAKERPGRYSLYYIVR